MSTLAPTRAGKSLQVREVVGPNGAPGLEFWMGHDGEAAVDQRVALERQPLGWRTLVAVIVSGLLGLVAGLAI